MKLNLVPLAVFCGFLISGCNFLWNEQSDTPFIPKPAQLNPESDAFVSKSKRSYTWTEGWTAAGKDTSVLPRTLVAQKTGAPLHFSATDGYSLPISTVTHLGFNPSVLSYDTSNVPEPGPALGFPTLPVIGWRTELTSGDLHFVRELTGLDTLSRPEGNVECWAFAETTYWAGSAVAMGKYSVGRNGMLDLYERFPNYNTGSDTTPVILWREVKAQ